MSRLKRIVKADIIKLSKTPFFILHVVIPLVGIGIFAGYQILTNYDSNALTINYFQVLTLIYPIIVAWLTTIVTDQEIEAGDGFFLLNTDSKSRSLLSKVILLVTGGLFSCLIIGVGYHVCAQFRADYSLPSPFIFLLVGLIWCCSLFLYLFHLWLGLCFGHNVNFAVAAVGLLLSALMLTGLGETIWFFFPCAWGIRLIPLIARDYGEGVSDVLTKIQLGIGSLIFVTLIMFVSLFIWFQKWEGRKNEE